MGLRLSPADAVARGLITKEEAEKITRGTRERRNPDAIALLARQATTSPPKATLPPAAAQLAACAKKDNEIPQRKLYDALCKALPGVPEWEREGLIPDRKFRADIYLHSSSICVEVDGFAFHKSKKAFQADRMRCNLFTLHGYRLIHAFTKQILDDEMLADLVALIVQAHNTPVATRADSLKAEMKTPAL